MSNLPAGASITTIGGKQCTAIPRTATTVSGDNGSAAAATSAESSSATSSSSTSTSTTSTTTSSTSSTTSTKSTSTASSSTSTTAAVVVSQSASSVIAPTPAVVPPQVTSTTSTALSTSPSSTIEVSSSLTVVQQSTTFSATVTSAISSTTTSDTEIAETTGSSTAQASSRTIVIAESAVTGAAISANSKTTSQTEDGLGKATQSVITGASSSLLSTSTSSPNSVDSSTSHNITSTTKVSVASIVGGVVGGIAFVGLIGLVLWLLRRRQRKRDSFLTPLTTARRSHFYEIDAVSVGPTGGVAKWKANAGGLLGKVKNGVGEIGTTLKKTVSSGSNGSGVSNVNLNRGNSQFLEQIPQHSRSNSAISGHVNPITVKDRFGDWLERLKDGVIYKLRLQKEKDMVDPFAVAREKQMEKARGQPDFSTLLAMEEQELQRAAEERRNSLAGSTPSDSLGSLGLNFSSSFDPNNEKNPFEDPQERPKTTTVNPFADPITQPKPSISKGVSGNYVDTIRRSRGQSISLSSNPVNQIPQSRYPSTIAASTIGGNRDTYRDTYMSSSTSGRKTRGRSDPFDLEPPAFIPAMPTPNLASNTASSYFDAENSQQARNSGLPANPRSSLTTRQSSLRGTQIGQRPLDSNGAQPRIVSVQKPRIISATGTYSSKYSSGTSMGGWGDPGPDLGPGSSGLRGNSGLQSVTTSTVGLIPVGLFEGRGADGRVGGAEEWDERRRVDDASAGSGKSAGRGIGKAR